MKKPIIALILSFALLMCMTACSGSKDPEPTPGGDNPTPPPVSQTIYEKLDDFADKSYQQIKLDIVTVTSDIQLSANYTLTQNDVSYRIEQLNMLPSDGNLSGTSPNYKTTHTGSAKIVEGEITEFDGQGIILPSYDELKGTFNFTESNFKNVVIQGNSLSADIVSPSEFYGADVDMNNLKIKVEYTETSLTTITISYSTTNATVQIVYAFEN